MLSFNVQGEDTEKLYCKGMNPEWDAEFEDLQSSHNVFISTCCIKLDYTVN
jgi:hypothetical protein